MTYEDMIFNGKVYKGLDRLRRVVSNTVISLLGQIVTWSSTLVLIIAYGRFLGDVKFGELYFATTFALLFGVPIERGFNQQLTRDVAQDPKKALRYFSNTILIKIVLWLGLYGLILLLADLLHYSDEVRMLIAISGLLLLSSAISSTFASLHFAFERTIFPVIASILEKGLSAIFGFILLKNGAGVEVMALILLGGSVIGGIWQAICFFRLVGFSFVIDLATIRELFKTSIPFLVYGMLGVIYYRIDTLLLSFMTNDAVVGWYGAAYRLFDTLTFLPSLVIVNIMYPVFSKLSLTSEKDTHAQADLKVAIEKSLNFLLFCGIPTATLMIVAAPNIIGFLYHRVEFNHTVPALQALAPGLVFLYINMVLGTVIVSIKQEKKTTIMAGVALVFNLGLNLMFIPLYQHVGAAIITSLTELLFIGPFIVFIPSSLRPLRSLWVMVKVIGASLIMSLAIWPLLRFNIFVILPVAVIVYLGAAMLLRTIPKEDLKAISTAMRRKVSRVSLVDEQQEIESEIASAMLWADEDTIPMRAVYDVMRRATSPLPVIDHAQTGKREIASLDEIAFMNEDTVPRAAIKLRKVPQTSLPSFERQEEVLDV